MPENDQVIVVGGGPAGLAAAIALRARNFPVLVVDGSRPPIEKVCGEGLLPETLESLRAIGIDTGKLPGIPFRGVRLPGGINSKHKLNFHTARHWGLRAANCTRHC